MIRWLRRLAGVLLWAWATYQAIAAVREWWRSTSPARDLVNGYPNEWGVRVDPLTPAETHAALEEQRAIARRVAELGESTGATIDVDELPSPERARPGSS